LLRDPDPWCVPPTGAVLTLVQTPWTGNQRLADTYGSTRCRCGDVDNAPHAGWCEPDTTDAEGNVLRRNT